MLVYYLASGSKDRYTGSIGGFHMLAIQGNNKIMLVYYLVSGSKDFLH